MHLQKKRVVIAASERMSKLPPYLFAEMDRLKAAALRRGVDLIDFGIGDPDAPTPPEIVEAAREAVGRPEFHRYPRNAGSDFFIDAAMRWMDREFGVRMGDDLAIGAVIGTKEGLAHVPLVFCSSGDVVLVPNPGYPVYRAASILADAVPVDVPLRRENGFLPDLEAVDRAALRSARVLFVNYPNNPTGAVMSPDAMKRVVEFARREDLLLVSDNSYSHIRFDGSKPASFLSVEGASGICLEFHSLSKTFNMTGWRVGFVAGGRNLVRAFMSAKENIDSGVFTAIQAAAARALDLPGEGVAARLEIYRRRREVLVSGLARLGWDVFDSQGTFYVWAAVPRGWTSVDFAGRLVAQAGIAVTPGAGFGSWGEGYVRFALTVSEEMIMKALGRLEQMEFCSIRGRAAALAGRRRSCRRES